MLDNALFYILRIFASWFVFIKAGERPEKTRAVFACDHTDEFTSFALDEIIGPHLLQFWPDIGRPGVYRVLQGYLLNARQVMCHV